MDIPVIEQAKIQAQILVPLVKALQAELGEERANALVRKALGNLYRRYGEEFRQRKNGTTSETLWGQRSQPTPGERRSIIESSSSR